MMPRPHDTSPAAWSVHDELVDQAGGEARVLAAVELSEAVRQIRLSGIRARDPDLDDREALAELIREDYGVELPPSR